MNSNNAERPEPGLLCWCPAPAQLAIWICYTVFWGLCCALGIAGMLSVWGWPTSGVFWMTWGSICLLGTSLCALRFRSLAYRLDAACVTKVSGRLWLHQRAVPLDRITSLDVRQGPLERLFGLGQVWLFTASTSDMSPEEKLVGVPDPERIRDAILQRVGQLKAQQQRAAPRGNTTAAPDDLRDVLEAIRDNLDMLRKATLDTKQHAPNADS